jgi:hypothetical protein
MQKNKKGINYEMRAISVFAAFLCASIVYIILIFLLAPSAAVGVACFVGALGYTAAVYVFYRICKYFAGDDDAVATDPPAQTNFNPIPQDRTMQSEDERRLARYYYELGKRDAESDLYQIRGPPPPAQQIRTMPNAPRIDDYTGYDGINQCYGISDFQQMQLEMDLENVWRDPGTIPAEFPMHNLPDPTGIAVSPFYNDSVPLSYYLQVPQ